jgi:hypothetical protein
LCVRLLHPPKLLGETKVADLDVPVAAGNSVKVFIIELVVQMGARNKMGSRESISIPIRAELTPYFVNSNSLPFIPSNEDVFGLQVAVDDSMPDVHMLRV